MSGLLPASVLPGLLETALKGRLNVQLLFEQAGIDPDTVGRADQFITLEQFDTLLSAAFAQSDDPFFGLTVGRENHYGNLDLLGNLMATSNTLAEGLQLLLRYKDLLVPYLAFQLDVDAGRAILSTTSDPSLAFTRTRPHNEILLATMVSIGRSLLGGDLGLQEVRFRHSQPDDVTPYAAFFEVPLLFDQSYNALVLSADRLGVALPTAFPRYNARLRRVADDQLLLLQRASGWTARVRALLQARMGQPDSRIEPVADTLGMTARTLQRKLRSEGISFGQLRDQVRHDYARHKLSQPACDMDALTVALGFSDTANFYHAFRRWEGSTPGRYRLRWGESK